MSVKLLAVIKYFLSPLASLILNNKATLRRLTVLLFSRSEFIILSRELRGLREDRKRSAISLWQERIKGTEKASPIRYTLFHR